MGKKQERLHQVVSMFFLAALVHFWSSALMVEDGEGQGFWRWWGIGLLTGAFLYHRVLRMVTTEALLFLIGLSVLHVYAFYAWNQFFSDYLATNEYRGNIFRGAFYGFRAPYYGHLYVFEDGDFEYHWPTLAMSSVFVGFIFYWRKKWARFKPWPILILLIALMIFFFGWHLDFEKTMTGVNCHYETFAEDLEKFGSTLEIFKTYNRWLPEMSMHNNHYPPGNLLVLRIEQKFIPYFSKIAVFLATILALIPLHRLMTHWKFNEAEKWITFLVYATNGAILFYPEHAMSPLMLPFSIAAFYCMVLALNQRHAIRSAIFFGLLSGIFGFFTFSVFFFLLFCAIYVLVLVGTREISLVSAVRMGGVSAGAFVLFFVVIYVIFGFDVLECLSISLANEKEQMDYEGIEDVTRYLITSTGNMLAYTGILTPMILGLGVHGMLCRRSMVPKLMKQLCASLIVTLLVLAFSNQFYLEVERIWIFLSPFWILVAGWFLAQFYHQGMYLFTFGIIAMSAAVSTCLTLWIDFCY